MKNTFTILAILINAFSVCQAQSMTGTPIWIENTIYGTSALEPIELTEKSFLKKFPNHRSLIVSFFKQNSNQNNMTQSKLIGLLDKITERKK